MQPSALDKKAFEKNDKALVVGKQKPKFDYILGIPHPVVTLEVWNTYSSKLKAQPGRISGVQTKQGPMIVLDENAFQSYAVVCQALVDDGVIPDPNETPPPTLLRPGMDFNEYCNQLARAGLISGPAGSEMKDASPPLSPSIQFKILKRYITNPQTLDKLQGSYSDEDFVDFDSGMTKDKCRKFGIDYERLIADGIISSPPTPPVSQSDIPIAPHSAVMAGSTMMGVLNPTGVVSDNVPVTTAQLQQNNAQSAAEYRPG